jgi:hypothetical protein
LFGNTERFIGIGKNDSMLQKCLKNFMYKNQNSCLFFILGVIVDTYDNDGTGLHPYVMLGKKYL